MLFKLPKHWTWVLVAVAVLVAAVAVIGFGKYGRKLLGPGGTRKLLSGGYEGFADTDTRAKFYMIKADWCPHCQQAKPKWAQLQAMGPIKTSDGTDVQVMDPIEGPEAKELGLEYNGFPTMVLVKGGQKTRCDADREAGAWASWIQRQ